MGRTEVCPTPPATIRDEASGVPEGTRPIGGEYSVSEDCPEMARVWMFLGRDLRVGGLRHDVGGSARDHGHPCEFRFKGDLAGERSFY
jgi:hypothetical protein